MPARFGHAVQAVGVSTVLLYGGMGCKTYDTVSVNNKNESRCIELVVLDDVWEFDVVKAFAGQNPFSKLDTSPRFPGMIGMSASTLPDSDSRILMFGGTSDFHARGLIYQESPRPTNDFFEVRNIEFRSRKASRADLQSIRQLSFNVGLQNSTHVLLFGGFIGNSLSSAVYIYEMAAQQPSLGFSRVNAWSPQAPEARSYAGLVKKDNMLYMFGGFSNGRGISDLWQLDIVSSVWTLLSKQARNNDKYLQTAFNAFSTFSTNPDEVVIVVSGGLQGGYKAGVSFGPKKNPPGTNFSVSSDNYFNVNGADWWGSVVTKSPKECCRFSAAESSTLKEACQFWLERKQKVDDFAEIGPDSGCEPEARAMHTVTFGKFANGRESLLVYGGVEQTGNALADFWHVDLVSRAGIGPASMSSYFDEVPPEVYPVIFVTLSDVAYISAAKQKDAVADMKLILLAYADKLDSSLKALTGSGHYDHESHASKLAELDLLKVYYVHEKAKWAIQGRKFWWQYVCSHLNGDSHFPRCPFPGCPIVESPFPSCPHVPCPDDGFCSCRMWNESISSISRSSISRFKTRVFENAQIESCEFDVNVFDVAFAQTKYNDSASCDRNLVGYKCMRGICMNHNTGSVFLRCFIYY